MSDPLVTPEDLGTYLGNSSIDTDRATMLLADAQMMCESILASLPDTAAPIVKRIAARAYVNINAAQSMSVGTAHVTYSPTPTSPGVGGGLYLSRADKTDLRRLAGGGGAFTIDVTPAGALDGLPWWDQNVPYPDGFL